MRRCSIICLMRIKPAATDGRRRLAPGCRGEASGLTDRLCAPRPFRIAARTTFVGTRDPRQPFWGGKPQFPANTRGEPVSKVKTLEPRTPRNLDTPTDLKPEGVKAISD